MRKKEDPMAINRREKAILKYIEKQVNANGYPPSVREIGKAVGLNSTATVHNYLAKLEQKGKLKGIITQNIDGLHTKAGNKKVYELHGTIYNNHCIKCGKYYDAKYVFNSIGIPKCKCGGIIKPDVTLYGEMLDESILNMSIHLISTCDTLIVAGTSLLVEPASSLIKLFKGKNLVILNRSNTKYCDIASLVINDSLGNIFKQLH